MSLEDKFKEIAKQHLPEAVAGELKDFMEQAKKDKEALEVLLKDNEKLEAKLIKVKDSNKELSSKISDLANKEDELDSRERELLDFRDNLQDRRRELDVMEAKMEVKFLKESLDRVENLTRTVFKNPTVKKTVIEDTPILRDSYTNEYNHDLNKNVLVKDGEYVENHVKSTETKEEIE